MSSFVHRCYRFACLLLLVTLTACSAKPNLSVNAQKPSVPLPNEQGAQPLLFEYSDPFEGFNRRVYYFNAKADEYVVLPVVNGYKAVTPDFVETGVSNFFSNLGEISTFINALLQFKGSVAAETFGRFALNSTLGLAGLFDIATPVGLDKQNEDLGQTLGYWGVGPGPYLVLPFIGPSNVRDGFSSVVDLVAYDAAVSELGLKNDEELFLSFLRSINARNELPFRYYESGSAFEYDQMKVLYMKYRELQIKR
ncbi:MlaA family lipoprotein [Thalassotalea marina]|uniref:VacJ family lipoprotein n=1 Tax=Thalassotalea marina TaxID=1673741 RepID=A0A919BBJ9_9GAMM|nr:VacJ family lipoprotein [Thalassotalea marina]GHF77370.1 hypothetical protein GCM10017161_00420 [Thalassotalea marina]